MGARTMTMEEANRIAQLRIEELEAAGEKWKNDYGDLAIRMAENDAKVERLEKAICAHKRDVMYDNGAGSNHDQRLWAALEGKQDG